MTRGISDISCLTMFLSKENDGCGYVDWQTCVNEPGKLTKFSGLLVAIVCAEVVCTCGRARWWCYCAIKTLILPYMVYMRRI